MVTEPIALTTNGRLRGRVEDAGTLSFRGVHYAAPPVGPLYLAAPAPVEPWDGVRDALANAASPPQPAFPAMGNLVPGDDYLNMNIFTPELGAQDLPVLVWFCVGGMVICNNAGMDGGPFARDGVVSVAVNHRVGAEGFALIEGAPDNRGVLDWLACLEWVQANIAAFGGEPSNVTIGGCSAGGATCHDLIAVERARGLFHRAIPLSGPPASGDRAAQEERNAMLSAFLGVPMTRDALADVPPDTLVKATMTVTALEGPNPAATTVREHVGPAPTFIPHNPLCRPVIDGDLLTVDPIDVYRAGGGDHVDLLIGHTTHEIDGAGFGDLDRSTVDEAFAVMGLTGEKSDAYRKHYPDSTGGALVGQAATDVLLRLWTVRATDARARAGPCRDYAYEFAFDRAAHGQDVAYFWDTVDAESRRNLPGASEVATEMHAAAVQFMKTGDPGWPQYGTERRTFKIFDNPSAVVDDPLHFEREVWDDIRR